MHTLWELSMHRTQIYLDDIIYEYLEKEKRKTKLSFSEIIRNNIKQNIQNNYKSIIDKMEKAAGSWENTKESPEQYIRKLRKDRTYDIN
jgi:predicted CopG family antitoxin